MDKRDDLSDTDVEPVVDGSSRPNVCEEAQKHPDPSVPLPDYLLAEPQSPGMSDDLDASRDDETKPGRHDFGHRMVCIEYPGVVRDEEKAMKTLGGIESISIAYGKRNRRLELRFRPDDYYCKPACASKHPTTALLIKVKIRRRKEGRPEATATPTAPNVSYDIMVLGSVDTVYRFKSMCDFQYLPTDGYKNIYDSLVPEGIPLRSWLFEETEYFLPPAAFSRMDNMQMHLYSKEKADSVPQHIIGCTRTKRAGHAIFVNFTSPVIPSEPRPNTLRLIRTKNIGGEHVQTVRKLFERRAIWSKSGLMTESSLTKDQMKFVLPAVAYYFVNGPWRVMWVRFGYDPRVHMESRYLQTLDFRLRTAGGLKTKVKAKRSYSNYLLPYKSAPSRPKVRMISRPDYKAVAEQAADDTTMAENSYIFRPGILPPSRQMFYQYCDLHVPEIQAMLKRIPAPPPTTKCHLRRGWWPHGVDDQCRNIINSLVLDKLVDDVRTGKNTGFGLDSGASTSDATPSSAFASGSDPFSMEEDGNQEFGDER